METLTKEELIAAIRTLELQRGTGVASLTIGSRTTTYKSDTDIAAAIDYFTGKLDALISVETSQPRRSRIVRWAFRKGV